MIIPNSSAMDATSACGGPITMLPQIVTGEPEQILAHVAELVQKAAQFASVMQQFEQASQQLEKAWSGGASESAVKKIGDSLQAFEKIIKAIEEGASLLGVSAGMVKSAQTAYQSVVSAVNPTVASLMSNPWTYGAAVALSTGTSATLRGFIQAVQGLLTALGLGKLAMQVSTLVSIISEIEQLMQSGTGDTAGSTPPPQSTAPPVIAPAPPNVVQPAGPGGGAPGTGIPGTSGGAPTPTSPAAPTAGGYPSGSSGDPSTAPAAGYPSGGGGAGAPIAAGTTPPSTGTPPVSAPPTTAPPMSAGGATPPPMSAPPGMNPPPISTGNVPPVGGGAVPPISTPPFSAPPMSAGNFPPPIGAGGLPAGADPNGWIPVDPHPVDPTSGAGVGGDHTALGASAPHHDAGGAAHHGGTHQGSAHHGGTQHGSTHHGAHHHDAHHGAHQADQRDETVVTVTEGDVTTTMRVPTSEDITIDIVDGHVTEHVS